MSLLSFSKTGNNNFKDLFYLIFTSSGCDSAPHFCFHSSSLLYIYWIFLTCVSFWLFTLNAIIFHHAFTFYLFINNKNILPWTSLTVQWLKDSALPMQGAWFQSLVKELRSHMPQDKKNYTSWNKRKKD